MADEPAFQSIHLACAKCQHEWTDFIAAQCVLATATASMNDIVQRGCPGCSAGGDAVLLGQGSYSLPESTARAVPA